jgi:hypothetical protein
MQVVGLIWGILAMLGMIVAFFPCLGSLNWVNVPFSIIGLIISVIAMNQAPPDKQAIAKIAVALCTVATLLGVVRLWLGGGIF